MDHTQPGRVVGIQSIRESLLADKSERPTVVGTGLITLDIVLGGDCGQSGQLYAGGTCGNVLTILSFLGWESYPVARLNGDTASRKVLQDLKNWGVNTRFARLKPEANTPIIVHQIQHDITGYPRHTFKWICPQCGAFLPGYKAVTIAAAKQVIGDVHQVKAFFMDRASPGAIYMAKAFAENGALIVFEPSGAKDERLFKEAIGIADILKYSEERARSFYDLLNSSVKPPLVVETRGDKGLRYLKSSCDRRNLRWREIEPFSVSKIKDAAGAGDWCTAGIIHMLGRNGREGFRQVSDAIIQASLNLGQAMAAWACRFEGARGGMYLTDKEVFHSTIIRTIQSVSPEIPVNRSQSLGVKSLRRSTPICPSC